MQSPDPPSQMTERRFYLLLFAVLELMEEVLLKEDDIFSDERRVSDKTQPTRKKNSESAKNNDNSLVENTDIGDNFLR